MKEIPILFSTPMVQAILDGRKSMTRRVIKPQPDRFFEVNENPLYLYDVEFNKGIINCPYGQPGDRLWVRETWFCDECDPACAGRENEDECPFNRVDNYCYGYKAQYITGWHESIKWRPSIHMPKAAARIWLEVTDVRVERLQEITLEDIEREGIYCDPPYTKEHFAYAPGMRIHWTKLWDSINTKRGYGWDENPWVWVVSFRRIEK